jgi:hypothetical protein
MVLKNVEREAFLAALGYCPILLAGLKITTNICVIGGF